MHPSSPSPPLHPFPPPPPISPSAIGPVPIANWTVRNCWTWIMAFIYFSLFPCASASTSVHARNHRSIYLRSQNQQSSSLSKLHNDNDCPWLQVIWSKEVNWVHLYEDCVKNFDLCIYSDKCLISLIFRLLFYITLISWFLDLTSDLSYR